jgi:uncharacterized repeat protein (TIGR03803 family)
MAVVALMSLTSYDAAQATSPSLVTLYNFTYGGPYGPDTGLVFGPSGAIYGAAGGGISGQGVIFELAPPAAPGGAWTENVIYQFNGDAGDGDGVEPNGGLVFGANAAIYGTTTYGGDGDNGTVFELSPPAVPGGAWTETVIYRFTGASDGGWPYAGLATGPDGVLYGTLYAGPAFQLTPPGSPGGTWTYAFLYNIGGDAYNLLNGPDGVLYGSMASAGIGWVFDLVPPLINGGAWTYGSVYSFSGSEAGLPSGPLLIGPDGTLFGSETLASGESGVVFELAPQGQGVPWTESVLHSLPAGSRDGVDPCYLVMGHEGLLYGATRVGGGVHNAACGKVGCGMLFQLKAPAVAGDAWTEVVLHRFTGGSDGTGPQNLIFGADGALYGTTEGGGSLGGGTLFRLTI